MTPCPMRHAVAIKLVCTCRTALASPVEPEVYIQSATSSDIVGAVNGIGSAFASSSSKKCASGNCERSLALAPTTMTARKCGSRSRSFSTIDANEAATTIPAARLSAKT